MPISRACLHGVSNNITSHPYRGLPNPLAEVQGVCIDGDTLQKTIETPAIGLTLKVVAIFTL